MVCTHYLVNEMMVFLRLSLVHITPVILGTLLYWCYHSHSQIIIYLHNCYNNLCFSMIETKPIPLMRSCIFIRILLMGFSLLIIGTSTIISSKHPHCINILTRVVNVTSAMNMVLNSVLKIYFSGNVIYGRNKQASFRLDKASRVYNNA